jgi:hypothetical protein
MQRAGLALGAPVGRMLGYRAEYESAGPGEVAVAI